jgi:pyrroloquinoline quinone (PQQ) biosynthesis protein C
LLENAWDESGGVHHQSRSHYWLAVNLSRCLGLNDQQIAQITPLKSAIAYTSEHYELCKEGAFDVGLGMICLIEEFTTPEFSLIFKAFVESVKYGGGIPIDKFMLSGGSEYFTANIADDERHREEMPKLVHAYLLHSGVDLSTASLIEQALIGVRSGMEKSIILRQAFFSEIYEFVSSGGVFLDMFSACPP